MGRKGYGPGCSTRGVRGNRSEVASAAHAATAPTNTKSAAGTGVKMAMSSANTPMPWRARATRGVRRAHADG